MTPIQKAKEIADSFYTYRLGNPNLPHDHVMSAWLESESLAALLSGEDWISVKDRLPNGVTDFGTMSDFVLVYISSTREDETGVGWGRYCHDRKRWFANHPLYSIEHYTITHWQPLPEPPKP